MNTITHDIFVTVMPSKNFCKQMQRQARSMKMFKLLAVGAMVFAAATEVERRKLYQAHRLYREQEAAHLKAHKQIQEAIRQAGELQSEIYKGLGVLPAEQLLGLCCRCISAMTGEDTLTRKYKKEYGRDKPWPND